MHNTDNIHPDTESHIIIHRTHKLTNTNPSLTTDTQTYILNTLHEANITTRNQEQTMAHTHTQKKKQTLQKTNKHKTYNRHKNECNQSQNQTHIHT